MSTEITYTEAEKRAAEMKLASGEFKTNHVLHLILTIVTGLGWLPIWPIIAHNNDKKRVEQERIAYGTGKINIGLAIFAWIIMIISILFWIVLYQAFTQFLAS